MRLLINRYLFFSLISLVLFSCSEVPMQPQNYSVQISNEEIKAALKTVANMRIFFGHQSVGKNILDGINDISYEMNQKINITENIVIGNKSRSFLGHTGVGKNRDPLSKIASFRVMVVNEIGDKVDVAFFKFCYVDFDQSTDINTTFQNYVETMKSLKEDYPQTTFVHFTVPLVDARLGLKGIIKKIIGRYDTKRDGNVKRNRFNDLLRNEYDGKEPVFDLAAIESTYPNGRRETFKKDEKLYFALVPLYTDDGGHLNKSGRKIVATNLLHFLASLSI